MYRENKKKKYMPLINPRINILFRVWQKRKYRKYLNKISPEVTK